MGKSCNFLFPCVLVMLFQSCVCWFINDINPKMLTNELDDQFDDVMAEVIMKQISFTYPGTKWCGPGDIADNYEDLGKEKEADMCCREHDFCPNVIIGGETKYNLTNTAFYTRLSCKCDNTFFRCLKDANTKTAKLIGNIYFNALQTKCFRKEYPVVDCTKKGGWFNTKCLEYSYDTDSNRTYQWFDVKDF